MTFLELLSGEHSQIVDSGENSETSKHWLSWLHKLSAYHLLLVFPYIYNIQVIDLYVVVDDFTDTLYVEFYQIIRRPNFRDLKEHLGSLDLRNSQFILSQNK